MNIVETWNKLENTRNNDIKIYDEMDIFYEDNTYIVFKANYSKGIAPEICPYRKLRNINFSTFGKAPWKTVTNYLIISVWRNITNTEQFEINDLIVSDMQGNIMDLKQYLLATPIKYEKLPSNINAEVIKELI